MNKRNLRKRAVFLVVLMLAAATILTMSACGKTPPESTGETICMEGGTLGSGGTTFTCQVTGSDGETHSFTVSTDKTTVGEALQEVGLIAGEMGQFGLYIHEVNGETAIFEDGGHYWSFYTDGEYAMSGVDTTAIDPACVYALKYE